MNYNNVKNPFDMYDDIEEVDFETDFEEDDEVEDEQETPKISSKKSGIAFNILMIASYAVVLLLAFIGIIALCGTETRGAVFRSIFFFT